MWVVVIVFRPRDFVIVRVSLIVKSALPTSGPEVQK